MLRELILAFNHFDCNCLILKNMIMKNNKFIIATLLVLLIVIAGCKKPVTVENYATPVIPNSLSVLTAISANTYAAMRSQNLFGWGYLVGPFACGEHIASEYGQMNLIDDPGTIPYNHPSASDESVTNTWDGLYVGVGSANAALAAADIYASKYAPATDSQAINYIRGESYFLRAWYYFQLECFYGQKYIDMKQPASSDTNILGVPLNLALPQSLADANKPRATARQVWTSIINDLKTASVLCPASWTGTEQQRATSWAAEGLLGKAYVFTQQWDSAEKYLGDVITNSGKSLMTFSDYTQAFNDQVASRGNVLTNYGPQKRFNQESLLEIYIQRVPGNGGYGIFGNPPNEYLGTSEGLFWAPSAFGDDGTTKISLSGRANIFFNDKNLQRFGFNIPIDSVAFSALIANQNFPDPNVAEAIKRPSDWYMDSSMSYRVNQYDDPRLYVCALEPYMDTVYCSQDGSVGDRKKRLVSKFTDLPEPEGGGPVRYGWSFKKYQTLDADLTTEADMSETDGADYYLLRMADIYLLEAEALMNDPSGPYAGGHAAIEYINAVHRRAYGYSPTLGSSSPVDYGNVTSATMESDPTDVNLYHNPLVYERFVELFAEGDWFFDIGRWGGSTNSIAGAQSPGTLGGLYRSSFGANEGTFYGGLYPNYNVPSRWDPAGPNADIPPVYCYPIPTTEINSNASIRAQPRGGQNFPY
jgi:starch-binding outer membrane protein, SusD/RagB family